MSYNLNSGAGEPQKVAGQALTANFLPMLGVKPALGRTFTADEEKPVGERVVILSHALSGDNFGFKTSTSAESFCSTTRSTRSSA